MKNVVITGTSSGIGFDLVKIYSKKKYNILSLSRSQINIKGVNHVIFDITDQKSIDNIKNIIKKEFKVVDILINNAGKLINKPFLDMSMEDFDSVFRVNLFGVANLIKNLYPMFNKSSHVVNISSIGGIIGSSKFNGLTAYSSSKGALNILTEVLAEEFKESGPKFNSLCLGSVQTKMLEEAFPGYKGQVKPKDMAKFIFDFANKGSSFFNGKVIPVSLSNP
ncbi:MAG: short-chain dehydrogenase [Flavobacteriaceae bacterium]|nr:short-chain dehydrogenase [Flavobacteriaceae bacterium]|tara:strand:- start:29846 stop:30511 length:666 start_codon:yes stop_codon:yes gene_type:complete